MMKQFLIGLILLINGVSSVSAQTTLFKKNVTEQMERVYNDSTGPNGATYVMSTFGYGFILPMDQNDTVSITDNAGSRQFHYGMRVKEKISEHFAINLDLQYKHQRFKLKNDEGQLFHIPGNVVKRTISQNILGAALSLRINFGKRGNTLGKYIDLGGEADWVFTDRLFANIKTEDASQTASEYTRVTYKNLDYTNNFQGFGIARMGWNAISIWGRYRFTDMFKTSDLFNGGMPIAELPRLSVGIEIALGE